MKIQAAFPSKYLRTADLEGKRRRLTIDKVAMESVSQDPHEADKPVLYFQGGTKGMVLNRTNSSVLEGLFGDETDDWTGKTILIAPSKTSFQGKMVDCLRLERAPDVPGAKKPAAPEPPDDFIDDSSIPF